jgi:hypothetical protein
VSACDEFTRPVMRSAAGLDPDKTWLQLFKKRQNAPARQTLPDKNLTCRIDPVHLKDGFRDIETLHPRRVWDDPLLFNEPQGMP